MIVVMKREWTWRKGSNIHRNDQKTNNNNLNGHKHTDEIEKHKLVG